jgi:DNA topoisomerase-3
MDPDGHVLSKKLAENVVQRITEKPATVTKVTTSTKNQAPPLPYNLSTLQIDAANRFSMSAQQVLDCSQRLYERHKLITYPRSDNRYLPMDHFSRASHVVLAISKNSESLRAHADKADTRLKSKAWDDKKVGAHHAIIPTEKNYDLSKLSREERQVFELVARQFLCQFYVKHEYVDTRVDLEIEGGLFVAKARKTKIEGWKQLFPAVQKKQAGNDTIQAVLPALKKGDQLFCERGELLEKQTKPPQHFTDATLLAAMTGIARFVKDKTIRKILKETDGLGTEATRAGIIELLFTRKFLHRTGKQIKATATGKALIQSLPDSATLPDMTAQWESVLDAISKEQSSYSAFMQPLTDSLHTLITQSKSVLPTDLKGIKSSKLNFRKGRRKSKKPATSKR